MNFNDSIHLCSHHPYQDMELSSTLGFLMLHSSQYWASTPTLRDIRYSEFYLNLISSRLD